MAALSSLQLVRSDCFSPASRRRTFVSYILCHKSRRSCGIIPQNDQSMKGMCFYGMSHDQTEYFLHEGPVWSWRWGVRDIGDQLWLALHHGESVYMWTETICRHASTCSTAFLSLDAETWLNNHHNVPGNLLSSEHTLALSLYLSPK